VHYATNYVNAFWNGTQLAFGDGLNANGVSLASVMDITAHELTHAVTEQTSDLVYSGASGALNEAMSDIAASTCEWFRDNGGDTGGPTSADNYVVGEDYYLAADQLRFMADPAADGSSRDFWIPDLDNIDVHFGSGIANLAFHLLAEGGTHPRGKSSTVVTGIGILDAGQIFFRTNTAYLLPSSDFLDARIASIQAATELFGDGSTQVTATDDAWTAVGVPSPPDYVVIETLPGLSSATSLSFSYPAQGATAMKFEISGGTGDADLYVRFGSPPTSTLYDCRPYRSGNSETCEFDPAQAGTYHVTIDAYAPFSGVTFTASAARPAAPWVVLSSTSFESGMGPYRLGGRDAARVRGAFASSPEFSVRLRDGSGAASSFATRTGWDLTGRTELRVQYSAIANGMEDGERYLVELSVDGGAFQPVGTFAAGTDFENGVRQEMDLQLALPGTTGVRVRFRCDASGNRDQVYLDDVVLSAR
jgi:vibriolysin